MVGYGPFFLCAIHKEGMCPSSGDIIRLIMMKELMALPSDCNQTAMGLPPAPSTVFLMSLLPFQR
jgi:hypothetical protein